MPASYPGSIKTFTVKIDGVDYVMAAHVNEIQDEIIAVETDLLTGINGSFISTPTGWASFTYGPEVLWKKVGKLVFISFRVEGTGNTVDYPTITLPFVCANDASKFFLTRSIDNGVYSISMGILSANSNTITFYKDVAGSPYTDNTQRGTSGQFHYVTP